MAFRLLVPGLALLWEGLPPALGVLAIQEGGAWMARRLGGEHFYLAAFGLRAILGFALFATLERWRGQGTLLQDDFIFDLAAWWLVRIGRGDALALFPSHTYFLDNVYAYFLAGVYALFGHTATVPRAANAAFAGLTTVLLADLGRQLFGQRVGWLVGITTVVLPTLVIWSLTTLKETLVLLGISAALWFLLRFHASGIPSARAANAAVAALVAVVLVADLRPGAALVLLATAAFLAVARLKLGFLVPVALLGAVAAALVGPVEIPPRTAWQHVEALGFALLAPAPWQVRGPGELAASLELLAWYVLLAGAAYTLLARPRPSVGVAALAVYGLVTWIGLAVTDESLGNLLRHRTMLTPPLLILGVGGLFLLARRPRSTSDLAPPRG